MEPPYGPGNHVSELNSNAHVGGGKENALDEVSICGSILTGFTYEPLMLFSHSMILSVVSVVSNNDPGSMTSAFPGKILEEVLKPFSQYFVSPEIYIFLLVDIADLVCEGDIANTA